MPGYKVNLPDGRVFTVNGPEGMSPEQVYGALVTQRPDLSSEALAKRAKEAAKESDPTAGMAGWQKFAAGAGKAIVDTGRGLGQLVGLTSQDEIDQAKQRDAALMDTGAGMVGNIAGHVGMAFAPAGAVGATGTLASRLPQLAFATPKAYAAAKALAAPNTVLGAGALGAGQGFVQPVASDESRVWNTALGAGAGAAPGLAVSGGRLVKDLAAPFTQAGQRDIAGRTLQRFAENPNAVLQQLANPEQLVRGATPTVAEATGDVGMAQLQRALQNNPDANKIIADQLARNNAARATAIRDIAGDAGQREMFVADRAVVGKEMYGNAFAATPKVTPWVKGELSKLQQRPSFQTAVDRGKELAAEEGLKINGKNAVQVAHYTKMALDDMISDATTAGRKQQANALRGTRDKLVSLMESKDFAPEYRAAREMYAKMSAPINQMDVGQELYDKLVPALTQAGGGAERMAPGAFAKAVQDADATAARALGRPGARMQDVLTPEQFAAVQGVSKDLSRSVGAIERGKTPGSPTAQNLITQNLLRQTAGPLGIPATWAEAALPQTLARPVSWAVKLPEARVLELLGNASVDPRLAKQLLGQAMAPPSAAALRLGQATRLAANPASVSGLFALRE